MSNLYRWLGTVLLAFLLAAEALAVPMDGLYEAVVPVEDTSAGQRQPALERALAKVLVRVSGSSGVLEQEGVGGILGNAGSLVQAYRYQQVAGAGGANNLELVASFGAVGVTRALTEVGVPVWGANRPAVLAWVATQTRSGRSLAADDPDNGWSQAMRDAAREKGIPLVLPEYDAADRQVLSLSDIWGLFLSPIRTASERYPAELLGVARIMQNGDGYSARWALAGAGFSLDGQVDGASPDAVSQAIAAAWAEALAARYAVVAGSEESLQRVEMVISGVDDLATYARVRQSLGEMEPISDAAPVRVTGDTLRLRVRFNGELELLREHLALERKLQEREAPPAEQSAADAPGPGRFRPIPTGGDVIDPTRPVVPSGAGTGTAEDEADFKSLYPVLYFTWAES